MKMVEEDVEKRVASAKTSDDAMKASGAFELWLSIKSEFELEAGKQLSAIRKATAALHERPQ